MKASVYFSLIIALVVLCFSAEVYAASDISKAAVCYVTIDGTKQGKFKGESLVTKQASRIDAYRYTYALAASGGAANAKLQQGIVVITKIMAGASPQLFAAMNNNEVLKTVTIEFVQGSQVFHIVKLIHARVTGIHQFTDGNTVYEDVSFSYQKIEVNNLVANTSATN